MNPKQQKTVDAFKAACLDRAARTSANGAEVKKFNIQEMADVGLVFVQCEVGSPDDEKTLASLLCRYYWHVEIGRSGGIRLLSFDSNLKMSLIKSRRVRGISRVVNFWHKGK